LESYFNKIYSILEKIPQEELVKKANKKMFSNGDLLFNQNGQSVEFNQYNNYNNGDSLKHIDWKQYAKRDKLYTKKFHSESNSNSILILDSSKSMNFKGSSGVEKPEYARLLFGVLSHILLLSKSDVASLSNDDFSGFKKNVNSFPMLYELIKEEEFNIIKKLALIKEIQETKNSTIFIISDFMFDTKKLLKEVRKMKKLNYDFYFIQVLTKSELEFDYKGIIRFKDMETSETILTEPLAIKNIYIEELKKHNDNISKSILENNMKYKLLNTDINIEYNILNLFEI